MIFRRSLIQEFSTLATGIFIALLAMVITTQLVKLLSQATTGAIQSDALAALIGFAAIHYFPTLLTLTLYIAILVALTRAFKDSEMPIWYSSGLSLASFVRPVLWFTLPLVVLISLVSMALGPMAVRKSQEYTSQLAAREEIAVLAPGQFRETPGKRVYFIDSNSQPGVAKDIFVEWRQEGRETVLIAQHGTIRSGEQGDKWLDLRQGYRYELWPDSLKSTLTRFNEASLRVPHSRYVAPATDLEGQTLADLFRSFTPNAQGEFFWRLSLPISALILSLLAIPLTVSNPRAGRSFNMLYALLLYFLYFNLMNTAQGMIGHGTAPLAPAFLLVHGGMLGIALFLIKRHTRGPRG